MINYFDPFVARIFSHPDSALNLRTLPNHTSRKRKRGKDRIMTIMQFDWLRAVVFKLNLKHLHVKMTDLLWVVV